MFSINKDKFFTILNDINKTCIYRNIKDKYYMDITKFNNILNYIDMNEYDLQYIQNRLIVIKNKYIPIECIKNIIICPFDTKDAIINEECENINYNFSIDKKKSYLTEDNNENKNESYCIKGNMNPAILNTVLLYMISTNLLSKETMIIFSLKTEYSKFDNDDIIEYLQKNNLNYMNNSFINIINLFYTTLEKGYPKKDYCYKMYINSDKPEFSNEILKKANYIQNLDFKPKDNYDVIINKFPLIKDGYRKINEYFKIPNYIEDRLFVFRESPSPIRFDVIVNNYFLVEWNTIEKYINELYYLIKGSENNVL